MKKTISGVLLALSAVFALVACGKKKTKVTTKAIPAGNGQTIQFYCWNNEFQSRFRKYYGDTTNVTEEIDILGDGTKVQWTMVANEGGAYQTALDAALEAGNCDMFCFEADYAKKYVESDYVVNLDDLGVDQSKQYDYTVDAVTNASGDVVGSSWQACPGAIAYNETVAKALFKKYAAETAYAGGYSIDNMATLLNDRDTYDDVAADLEGMGPKYAMMIGPADWYRVYGNNLSAKMYNKTAKTITVDKNIFKYANDTKAYDEAGYLLGDNSTYGLWGKTWGANMAADTNALTLYVCPWFTDFSLKENCPADEDGASPWRVVEGYASWFWGGTWLAATNKGIENADKKKSITDIIKKMTTDKATLRAISDGELDFTNNEEAMNAKAADAKVSNDYFGGQNVYAIYAESVVNATLEFASDYDQQITENFQKYFLPYIQGTDTAKACWAEFVKSMGQVNKNLTVSAAEGVDVTGNDIVFN